MVIKLGVGSTGITQDPFIQVVSTWFPYVMRACVKRHSTSFNWFFLWFVGLDLYLNFLFLKTYLHLPVIHAFFFPAGMNLKCSMCAPSRCSEQAWCWILQDNVVVSSHSAGKMDMRVKSLPDELQDMYSSGTCEFSKEGTVTKNWKLIRTRMWEEWIVLLLASTWITTTFPSRNWNYFAMYYHINRKWS
jgi:hypothetical protein